MPGRPVDTIGGVLASAAVRLRESGIETARLDAELLLGHVLHTTRTRLAIDANDPVDATSIKAFESLLDRRIQGESVAYLIGFREFMRHEFAVGPGVLVPRPETELMVERACETIPRLWPTGTVRVLDLCTGSGAIACSLALSVEADRLFITGSDVSEAALAYARRNRAALGLDYRVELVQGDLLRWTSGPWDLILTNPPYLRPDQIDDNPDLIAEPRLALDGGHLGLELIERILVQATSRVAATFAMMIEIDPDQAAEAAGLAARRFPEATVTIVPDLTRRARFIDIERVETNV
ncbi:MAG: peptide chain release factor N(5)-glutamine methyltransferase [Thermomicrobiales bacterium]|nr:peptide chain release factor N(5)-glutamine methyltransferase [Thermomicrobiales bacterium]